MSRLHPQTRFARFLVGGVCLLASEGLAQSIFTIAGGGSADGRPATTAALDRPRGIAVDLSGNLYIADTENHRIRRVSLLTGVITTVAGSGSKGFSGDGGAAVLATLDGPADVAVDHVGNLYIADTNNHRIRKVQSQTGRIQTVAGRGGFAFSGDGGPATAAQLLGPTAIAVDPAANIYFNDTFDRIRKVTAATGIITTIAGSGSNGFAGDGGPATLARLNRAGGVAVDRLDNLYIADYGNDRIRKVDSGGIITSVAGTGSFGFSGDAGPATAANLHGPNYVAVDSSGNLYIGESNGSRIRKVEASTGIITTVAGGKCCNRSDGIPAIEAHFGVWGLTVDPSRNIFITDVNTSALMDPANGRIRRVDAATGFITTVAGAPSSGFVFTGDGGPATAAVLFLDGTPEFSQIRGVAVDRAGNLYIADQFGNRIRRVNSAGVITTMAGGAGGFPRDGVPATATSLPTPAGIAVDGLGNVYATETSYHSIRKIEAATGLMKLIAGNHGPSTSGDGGPATLAGLGRLEGLAVDSVGDVLLVDSNRVRKIAAATGIITTIVGSSTGGFSGDGGPATAATLNSPSGLAVDAADNVFIADSFNNRIRRVDARTGTISTIAGSDRFGFGRDGGPATAALLWSPTGIALDAAGNIYIAERSNFRIRKVVAATKIITTIAGTGAPAPLQGTTSGDQGPATRAGFALPNGLAADPEGNLYIADSQSNRVRVVYACIAVTAPQLLSPSDGSSGVSTSPRLAWSAAKGAFRYDVLLDTVSPPKQVAAGDVAETTFAPSNLEPLTTYYWQVVAKGDPYCVPFSQNASQVRSFTTAATCTPPGLFAAVSP